MYNLTMKAIVIGASLSGKTTLIRYLKTITDFSILEIDEELTRLNDGVYPLDNEYKHRVLVPQIIKKVLGWEKVIFFTNTDYFTSQDLKKAREKGFLIIQLDLNLKQLQKRNENRIKNEGYSDLNEWLEGMVRYQTQIREEGLVDKIIDGDRPTEDIAKELVFLLN